MATTMSQNVSFTQTNLVSDGSVPAAVTDPKLVNPWGVAFGPNGPFWISDNGSGAISINDGSGKPVSVAGQTSITVAPPAGQTSAAAPTGQVFNSAGSGFNVSSNGKTGSSVFLVATEDGTISGWSPSVDPSHTVLAVDNSQGGNGAVYKGLAIGTNGGNTMLYAANFRNGTVDVFNSSFQKVNSFTDPNVPKGFAPFNVQVLDNKLFVTFAEQDAAKHDDVAGKGNGFVDEFDLNGNLVSRVASGGTLDSPWGLAIAPPSFGQLGGDLLVGNFGDGTISAYNLQNDSSAGQLTGTNGQPITIQDLWALTPGSGGNGSDTNKIYFTAGLQNEMHGLFGSLSASPSSTQAATASTGGSMSTSAMTANSSPMSATGAMASAAAMPGAMTMSDPMY